MHVHVCVHVCTCVCMCACVGGVSNVKPVALRWCSGDEPVLILQRNAFLRIEEEREMLSRLRRPEIMAVDQIKMVVNLLYCEVTTTT